MMPSIPPEVLSLIFEKVGISMLEVIDTQAVNWAMFVGF
jgi:hypothetical protein